MIRLLALALSVAALLPGTAFAQSLEEMAGQMIVVGFAGDSLKDKSVQAVRDEIASGTIGGVMYLKANVKSLAAVEAMNKAFLAAAPGLPPFVALDQEGGIVERLTRDVGFAEVPNARTVAAQDTPVQAGQIYARMAASLAELGFTVNFGPVVDLDVNPDNPIIGKYGRSYGRSADVVADYAARFVAAHRQAGVLTALKHFPGHGSSTTDSHEGFVDISKTWTEAELAPYRRLVAEKLVDMVMVGHLYHEAHGGGAAELPASLSSGWIEDVLRKQIGFDGVVISDDLEMGAIRKRFTLEQTVVRAVRAGENVLLFSNTAAYDPSLGEKIRAILVKEAKADPAFRALVEDSYKRIVALKKGIGR